MDWTKTFFLLIIFFRFLCIGFFVEQIKKLLIVHPNHWIQIYFICACTIHAHLLGVKGRIQGIIDMAHSKATNSMSGEIKERKKEEESKRERERDRQTTTHFQQLK